MKKNDTLILAGLLTYTYLFYNQNAGVNFFLFNVLIMALLYIKDKTLIKSKQWVASAIGCIFSSIAIFIYGNPLSVFTNIISLGILANYSINRKSSLIFASIHSSYTFVSVIPYYILRISQSPLKTERSNKNIATKILIILIPIIITLIFILIYRNANPVFKSYTDKINFDFISWSWIRFVLIGWILLYAFFNQINIPFLRLKDESGDDRLNQSLYISKLEEPRVNYENLSGIILFALLNILLLFLNVIDINSIWISSGIPSGVTHSEFVHQGVGMLIFSILIAIAIILFYFRGTLNFYNSNQTIKILAYIWIIQNAILVITTASKNQLYIDNFSLTYKRIGVYIYLLLTLIGLISTFIKINQTKSNWFLFRKNAWAFYTILVASCFINWDLLITHYNITNSKKENLDKNYLLSLSYSPIPDLFLTKKSTFSTINESLDQEINFRASEFIQMNRDKGWQSFNLEDKRIQEALLSLNREHLFTSIDLSGKEINSLENFKGFEATEELNLANTGFTHLEDLKLLPKLKKLDLSKNHISNLSSLPDLPEIISINISDNYLITDLSPLKSLSSLTEIDFTGTEVKDIEPLLSLRNLSKIKCKELSRTQYDQLLTLNPSLEITAEIIYGTPINATTSQTH